MKRLLQNEHHLLGEVRGGFDRLEIIEGLTGRRSWPDDVKARIVLKSFEAGARVNEVARRNGLSPQHLSTWRGMAHILSSIDRKGPSISPGHNYQLK
jgi:transposase